MLARISKRSVTVDLSRVGSNFWRQMIVKEVEQAFDFFFIRDVMEKNRTAPVHGNPIDRRRERSKKGREVKNGSYDFCCFLQATEEMKST